MKYILRVSVFFGAFLACFSTVSAQTPFAKAMKAIFGDQYPKYQWLNYPIDNYGIGTMFEAKRTSTKASNVSDTNAQEFLCSTFDCLQLGATPRPSLSRVKAENPWMYLGKGDDYFADAGCGSDLTLKDFAKKKKKVISAFLPQILKIVGVDFIYSNEDNITLNGTIMACDRRILAKPLATFLSTMPKDKFGVKNAFDNQRLIVVKKDIVVQNIELNVASNSQLGVKLSATMGPNLTKIFGDAAKSGVEVSRGVSGDYKIKATQPLIVGLQAVTQPKGAGIGGGTRRYNVDSWTITELSLPN